MANNRELSQLASLITVDGSSVGIGTTNPTSTLTVNGALQIQQDSLSSNRLVFRGQPSSSYRWNIDNNGATNNLRFFREDDATTANGAVYAGITSTGVFQFDSGYGSAAAAYGCRAWVNFDGTSNSANLTGTYSQSGTTVTVTVTNHGLIAGNVIFADATSGTAVDGTYTVATVISSSQFTYTAGTSLTTSGNMTLRRNTIRASGNVSSVADNGVGDYTVNFTTAMPDTDYAISGGTGGTGLTIAVSSSTVYSQTVLTFNNSFVAVDRATIHFALFR